MKKINQFILKKVIILTEWLMPVFGLKIKNFYTEKDFPWLLSLEENAESIKEEFINQFRLNEAPSVLEIDPNLRELTQDGGWKAVLLYNHFGPTVISAKYPGTLHVIKQLPDVVSAAFSILEPKKSIPLHRGPYRGILFVHLGIIIPHPNSNLKFIVNGETKYWSEGKAFAFEDSFNHEVKNTSENYRAVLLLELVRKDIPAVLIPIHKWVLKQLKRK